MSLHRKNPRRDAGEKEIVAALEKVGALVQRLSCPGIADLLVCYKPYVKVPPIHPDTIAHGRPALYLLEVKRPQAPGQRKGRATKAQQAAAVQGWPSIRVETVDEALQAIGVTR
jgi:hypothetical protein